MPTVRLIDDAPASGSWNMAVDHVLLETADREGQMSIRFYAWSEPTLSLGYFQNFSERAGHPSSLNCPVVRRSTGGGAILHDQEVTYSMIVPSSNRWSKQHEDLYWMMHRSIIRVLAERGIQANLFDALSIVNLADPKKQAAFLCFQRRSSGDVVLNGQKIGGSAQRRKKNALLQHGSVLFRSSEFAPDLNGIEEISGTPAWDRRAFLARWIRDLEIVLESDLVPGSLTDEEVNAVENIERTVYDSTDWNQRR